MTNEDMIYEVKIYEDMLYDSAVQNAAACVLPADFQWPARVPICVLKTKVTCKRGLNLGNFSTSLVPTTH